MDRNVNNQNTVRWNIVALRKESVDRNMRKIVHIHAQIPSLSARRAWIEIMAYGALGLQAHRRSPQGERG